MSEIWKEKGKYYGYPECCIEHFCKNTQSTDEQKRVSKGYGFIPCPSCTEKIIKGDIKLENLIKNRKCEHPFPFKNKADKIEQLIIMFYYKK